MALKEFKSKSDVELRNAANEKRESLRHFRFNIAGSKARHIREGRNLRKEIARIETELNSRTK